jgi:hypothetical protein
VIRERECWTHHIPAGPLKGENVKYDDLVQCIRDRLADYQYTEPPAVLRVGGVEGAVLATPRIRTVRYLCAVLDLPKGCETPREAEDFFGVIRRSLSAQYARFPYWKELGTYLVLICGSRLFDAVGGAKTRFKDGTGLHMNVMLGTVFLDPKRLMSWPDPAWGLFHSRRHFEVICGAVNEWCRRKREQTQAAAEALPRR